MSDKYKKLYAALCDMESKNVLVTKEELAKLTGYTKGTVGVYIRNKLNNVYLSKEGNKYKCTGILNISHQDFIDHMCQQSSLVKLSNNKMIRLINRSVDSFHLATEVYSRPTLSNRVEMFCIIFINAWELLLKAILVKNYGENTVYETDGSYISISKALKKVYADPNDPIRANLEIIINLRNDATHYLIEECTNAYARWFQSGIINYACCLQQLGFKDKIKCPGQGLILSYVDYEFPDVTTLGKKYDNITVEKISKIKDELNKKEQQLASNQFAIPIEYKVSIARKNNEGQLLISIDNNGEKGYLVEVPKDPDKSHPHRETDAIRIIRQQIPEFDQTTFRAILFHHGFKKQKSNQYHYLFSSTNTHKYSDMLITYIISKIKAEPLHSHKCREHYLAELKKRRNCS